MPRHPAGQQAFEGATKAFAGFAMPTSNTTYTPNQFFDVCLPYCPRGTVRLVALLIRKTLGWCDTQGRPQQEQHAVSYADLEAAGVSRDMIRSSLNDALRRNFISCVQSPERKRAGKRSSSGLYELKWDDRGEYIKDPLKFQGFFAGEGNRTYIPNDFFNHVVRNEPLAVVKVVGSVIRFSIGFQTKWGHRRQNVSLSYQHIQNYSHLKDRKTLSQSIRVALEHNYIERVERGYFDPNAGKLSRAAVYAVKWLSKAADQTIGQKSLPAKLEAKHRSENPTGNGQKSLPADRSENPTDIEIKQINKTLKQQPGHVAVAFEWLKGIGFDTSAAHAIASKYPPERIARQIELLPTRNVKSNRLGLLRAAIEQDWPAAGMSQLGQPNFRRSAGVSFEQAIAAADKRLRSNLNQLPL